MEKDVVAPVKKGAKLGTIELKLSGETLATVDLIAKDNVERSDLEYNLNIAKQFTSSAWFKTAIGVIILLIVLYIIFYITVTRKKRRKNKRVNKKRRF